MSRRFDVADISRTQRIMQALLPEGVTVNTSAIRDGWELSVVICGKHSCHTYEFTRSLADRHLLVIAETWATGDLIKPIASEDYAEVSRKALASRHITERNDLAEWCRKARKGDKVSYFIGELSKFRFEAPRRILQLQTLSDKAGQSQPRPSSERAELASLQETLDLLEGVTKLHNAAAIELVQHRTPDGSGATYYAVKRGPI